MGGSVEGSAVVSSRPAFGCHLAVDRESFVSLLGEVLSGWFVAFVVEIYGNARLLVGGCYGLLLGVDVGHIVITDDQWEV